VVILIQEREPVQTQTVVPQVRDALKQHGYALATIQEYEARYCRLIEYLEARDLDHFTQEVGLAYISQRFGFKPDDWTAGGLSGRVRAAWSHLLMLWHFHETASVVGRV
jgi:hypothetical protein